ncbi:hypothetical protein [Caldimonas caldifontis]|uniref:hypothetical protein n=1 Tax=Caldimonas caldifontis TaxID=1452508 RepID=UPI0014727A85|nr:hypothetical protein [Caldimonas caldifontis]
MLIVLLSLGVALALRLGWMVFQLWSRLPRCNEDFSLELGPLDRVGVARCVGDRHE